MQTLVEAATHIAQEIERTRQHLSNLEQALEGLKPLITVEVATATLTFAMPEPTQTVEDLSVVNADTPVKRRRRAKAAVEAPPEQAKKGKSKAAKVKASKAPVVEPTPVVEAIKLPATGADLWLKCVGRKKVTVAQITDAALKKLNLDDSAKSVISTRAKVWAYSSVKKGTLIEVGTRDGSKLYQLAPVKTETAVPTSQTAEPVEVTPLADFAPIEVSGEAA